MTTIDDYRERMIKAFINAGHDELIAIVVPATEKDFENLEYLIKNYYKNGVDRV